jgi:enoyl-CoA hydratase/carnithine racemase
MTISNPGKRGALDRPILDALAHQLPRLNARCVIITGEGRAFSAGYDIGDLPDAELAQEADKLVAHPFEAALCTVEDHRFPTIAALNGLAIGGGLELALACDLRIASSTVSLAMPPAKLGLVYSHTGIARFLEIVGAARTRELFLLGRRIDAQTAYDWGLVNQLVAPELIEQKTLELAREIAAGAPLALAGNKRVISAVARTRRRLDPGLERELLALRAEALGSEDFREGVRAFAEKRPPVWRAR